MHRYVLSYEDNKTKEISTKFSSQMGLARIAITSKEEQILFDKNISSHVLFMVLSGEQFFLVERDKNMICTFYHYTPGRDTLETSVDINQLKAQIMLLANHRTLNLIIQWGPNRIDLIITSEVVGNNGVMSKE